MQLTKLLTAVALGAALASPVAAFAESATQAPKFGEYQAKGFLTDYSKLPSTGDDGAYRYRDPAVDFSKYNKLLVDRVKIWFKDDSEYKGIDPEELKTLTDYFYKAIETAMGDAYPMVAEPGPDVLRLRIAVTDIVPNKPEASVTSLIVPFLWVGEAGAGAATKEVGATPFTGEASIEIEALDSTSSQQLGAYIETRLGKKYDWTHGVTDGVTGYINAYSKWEYTKQAMDFWAKLIRQRMDEAHGKSSAE
jgi:hypothetical protein